MEASFAAGMAAKTRLENNLAAYRFRVGLVIAVCISIAKPPRIVKSEQSRRCASVGLREMRLPMIIPASEQENKMKLIFKASFLLSTCFFLLLFSSPSHAYLSSSFSARELLDAANVVCYAQVVSLRPYQIQPDASFSPPMATASAVATVEIISSIKGKAPVSMDVVFHKSTGMVIYTELVQGEAAILFLKRDKEVFRFVDGNNGKLQVPWHQPLAYKSASPVKRMAAELIFASQVDKGLTRLACIGQLSSFDLPEVVSYLRKLASMRDMAVQGGAYASLIDLDHPPQALQLAQFMKRRDDTQSLKRFRTTGYSNGNLRAGILGALENRFNVIWGDFDSGDSGQQSIARKKAAQAAAQRWKTFDLIGFLKVAMANIPPDQDDGIPTDGIAVGSYGSIADMIGYQIDSQGKPAYLNHTFRKGSRIFVVKLLNHPNPQVNQAAARAIDNMIAEKHSFPYPQGGRQDEVRYLKTVREWLKQHPRWIKSD